MADFMADGFSNIFFVVAQSFRENQRGFAVIAHVVERAERSDAAITAHVAADGADKRSRAVSLVAGIAAGDGSRAGFFRGHVHIEGGVILRNALPDLLDGRSLGIAENGGVAVRVPRRADDIVAVV